MGEDAPRRRADEMAALVRRWVTDGAVRVPVGARFLALHARDATRRRLRWEGAGRPLRRSTDSATEG